MVVDVFFFNAAGLCITFTESTVSITDACDLSSQGVSVESDGLTFGDILRYVMVVYSHVGSLHEQDH